MKYLYYLLLFCLLSCVNKNNFNKEDKAEKSASLFEIVYQNDYGGYNKKENKVIESEALFNKLIDDLKLQDVQKIDFLLHKVVVLNLGEKSTGGYSISLENITEKDDLIVIDVKETSPKVNELVTDAFTHPICIVKVRTKKEIVFKTKTSSK